MKTKKVGLFFGSFNPIHNGHIAIANYMLEKTDISKVIFIVSPHNPLKEKAGLLSMDHRLKMVQLAISGNSCCEVSDIELRLPQPSYTINTIKELLKSGINEHLTLLLGTDNLASLHRWKDYEELLSLVSIYCYPRNGAKVLNVNNYKNVAVVDAPKMDLSSTLIRNKIKGEESLVGLMPTAVINYIQQNHLYKQ